MLDPLSGIGVASSLVQFVDFAGKLTAAGYSAYRSVEGATRDNLQLEDLTSDLRSWSQRLDPTSIPHLHSDEIALRRLSSRCQSLADELLTILASLKIKPSASFRSLAAVKQSLRSVAKADSIKRIDKELSKVRAQLSANLLAILRNGQSNVSLSLYNLATDSEKMHTRTIKLLDTTKLSLQEALALQGSAMSDLSHRLDQFRSAGSVVATSNSILESLLFPEMQMRHSAIHEAYAGTFSWVFEDSASNFRTWLEFSSGIFWISGKAGSGKSTLMKFITGHAQTQALLQEWSGGSEVVMASYYFWSAGYDIQKSQLGLLQSLLFQILRQCPEIIPALAPKRWEATDTTFAKANPWTRQELSEAIVHAILSGGLKSRFCFFIDGLDEYAGDHHELIQDLNHLTKGSNIKICVSSRPWNAFQSAYGIHHDRLLKLQDLTKHDMRTYVAGMLEEDPRFSRLAQTDGRAEELGEQIQQRAQGVFLWVYLVIRSLRRGLTEADDLPMLRKRLEELPTDLEDFFRHMLDSVELVYQEYTSALLQIAVHASGLLPSILVSYLPLDLEDPNWVLQPKSATVSWDHYLEKQQYVALCINKWCKDLLEVNFDSNPDRPSDIPFRTNVDYLHRTVRDYLGTEEIQSLLRSRAKPDFNPRSTLLRLSVGLAKDFEQCWSPQGEDSRKIFYEIVVESLSYANLSELRDGLDTSPVLSELERAASQFFAHSDAFPVSAPGSPRSYYSSSHWTASFGPYESSDYNAASFSAFALNFGVQSPLKAWLRDRSQPLTSSEADLLLICVLLPYYELAKRVFRPNDRVELAKHFLEHGANVNQTLSKDFKHHQTIWSLFIMSLRSIDDKGAVHSDIVPLTRLLVHHGASLQDPRVSLEKGPVLQTLLHRCPKEQRAELQDVLAQAEKWYRSWFSWGRFGRR